MVRAAPGLPFGKHREPPLGESSRKPVDDILNVAERSPRPRRCRSRGGQTSPQRAHDLHIDRSLCEISFRMATVSTISW